MITRDRKYVVNGIPTQNVIYSAVAEFLRNNARLRKLKDYYDGTHDILKRVRSSGLPNNMIVHNYPRFIATMASGYLIGDPVAYEDEKQEAALEPVMTVYRRMHIDSVDAELAKHASVYGRAVELNYVDDQANPRTVAVSPVTSFVVYDNTAAIQPLFGVYFFSDLNDEGNPDGFKVFVYSEAYVLEYKVADLSASLLNAQPINAASHFFGGVPLNEYWNNEDETGDFESVMALIDAYNTLESDRINDKEQFTDALLVMVGCNLDPDAAGRSPWRQLREDKGIAIPADGASIQYLNKALTEADVDVLRGALNDDIHKLSMVPDLTDQNFAQNASGVAMKYKLIGFEQLTKIKERWFKEGLLDRLRLYAHFMAVKGAPVLDTQSVTVTFKRGLPSNELEQAQIIQALDTANAASAETRVKMLHPEWTIDAVDEEVAKINNSAGVPDPLATDVKLGDQETPKPTADGENA